MGTEKPIKVFLYTSYSPASYRVISALIQSDCKLAGVLFAPATQRSYGLLGLVKNFITTGSCMDPVRLLKKHGIFYDFTDDHNGEQAVQMIQKKDTDVLLLYGTKIIKEHVLQAPKVGVLNSHSALLPKYRGGKSEFWILYNEEPQYAGVTIHWVTPGLDEGDIFLQRPITVEEEETPTSLRAKSIPVTAELFVEAVERIGAGDIVRIKQDESKATKYRRPTEEQLAEFKKRHGK